MKHCALPTADRLDVRRLERERKTIHSMIAVYCRGHHKTSPTPCEDCRKLYRYAVKRLANCPFQAQKPTCGNCRIHCYNKEMATRVRKVMRYSGPRMILFHPILAILHMLDGLRKPPTLPAKRSRRLQ